MEFTGLSCGDFVSLLGSKAPVPGGGGAAALVGAVGIALGNMTASLTMGKKKYAAVEDELRRLKEEAERLQGELLDLVQRDAEVFGPLAGAYGLPSGTPAEREEKAQVMEAALREACSVPLSIMEKCGEAIRLLEQFAAKGSRLAVSDAGAGALFCKAALGGASLNVYINTAAMKDRSAAEEINRKADVLLGEYEAPADGVFKSVREQLK
ncbi:MAG: cyclodeaminase/cyclohydrolase family protein [Treponema sp.]|jgi:formiminotetrahydrofolate cyclodeaminase|nr:cyclodeaminase/cyclohydrolase family protein [Treponema sp.]